MEAYLYFCRCVCVVVVGGGLSQSGKAAETETSLPMSSAACVEARGGGYVRAARGLVLPAVSAGCACGMLLWVGRAEACWPLAATGPVATTQLWPAPPWPARLARPSPVSTHGLRALRTRLWYGPSSVHQPASPAFPLPHRACLEFLRVTDQHPHILQLHDWHAAAASLLFCECAGESWGEEEKANRRNQSAQQLRTSAQTSYLHGSSSAICECLSALASALAQIRGVGGRGRGHAAAGS